jgi:hypothetical protein
MTPQFTALDCDAANHYASNIMSELYKYCHCQAVKRCYVEHADPHVHDLDLVKLDRIVNNTKTKYLASDEDARYSMFPHTLMFSYAFGNPENDISDEDISSAKYYDYYFMWLHNNTPNDTSNDDELQMILTAGNGDFCRLLARNIHAYGCLKRYCRIMHCILEHAITVSEPTHSCGNDKCSCKCCSSLLPKQ